MKIIAYASRFRLFLLVLLWAVITSGCYASAGPTIGYRNGDGFTFGAEVNGAGWLLAQGNVGFLMRSPRETDKDRSAVASFYGTIGPGFYGPPSEPSSGGEIRWGGLGSIGIGAAYDRESETSFVTRFAAGPSIPLWYSGNDKAMWNGVVFNLLVGFSYWDGAGMFYLSPQVGAATILPHGFMD